MTLSESINEILSSFTSNDLFDIATERSNMAFCSSAPIKSPNICDVLVQIIVITIPIATKAIALGKTSNNNISEKLIQFLSSTVLNAYPYIRPVEDTITVITIVK